MHEMMLRADKSYASAHPGMGCYMRYYLIILNNNNNNQTLSSQGYVPAEQVLFSPCRLLLSMRYGLQSHNIFHWVKCLFWWHLMRKHPQSKQS